MTDVNDTPAAPITAQDALITVLVEVPAAQGRDAIHADVTCRMPVAELGRALQLDGPTMPPMVEALRYYLAEKLADPGIVPA